MFQVGDLVRISALGDNPTHWAELSFKYGWVYLVIDEPDPESTWFWGQRVSNGQNYCLTIERAKKV